MDNLTIIVPYRNERAALNRLLESLPADLPVIVVDDQSETPPERWEDVTYIRPERRGYFAGAVNEGIQACKTDVLVLNQDVWFDGLGWLDQLAELRRTYAAIGQGVAKHPAWPKGYIDGRFMFMRRDALAVVGLFDERNWPLWGCTCDWQTRACRRGFRALPLPDLDWYHHEPRKRYGASIERALQDEPGKKGLFIRTPPLISVVIPTFNYGRFLPDAINSLIGGKTCLGALPGQTFQGFTMVIVDDASTDDTAKIAAGLADPWQGIRYIRRGKNGGTAAALNTGAADSLGRYIQVLSADDMLEPGALEAGLRVLEANPKAFAYSDLCTFTKGTRARAWPVRDFDFDELLKKNHVPAGIMLPREAWQAVGGWPEAFRWGREDWAMAVALGRAGWCGQHIAKPLYLYRRQGQNRTLANSTPRHREQFTMQMRATFSDVYGGERPMGCCGSGSGRRSATGKGAAGVPPTLPGAEGMVLMEYVGRNVGRTTWVGAVTKTVYTCSGSKRQFYVDRRDVPGLVGIVYDRATAFRVIPQPPEPPPKPEPKPKPAPASEPEPAPMAMELVVPEPPVPPAAPPATDPLTEAEVQAAPEQAPVAPKRRRTRKSDA